MAGVVVEPSSLQVAPGGEAVAIVRVRNTGVVVDAFNIDVLGAAAPWTTVVPPVLSLFPGADGTAELHFRPPRAASLPAGPLDYGVRVVPAEDADASTVEEAVLEVLPYVELAGRLTPRTSETKRTARHVVALDNKGNAGVEVALSALDPDDQLAFDIRPPSVSLPGGASTEVSVKVATRSGFLKGPDRHRPFQVTATAAGQPPITMDATLVQRAGMPKIVIPLIAAAVVLGAFLLVLPALKKNNTGSISLTSKGATTTTAAAADDGSATPAGDAQAQPDAGGTGGDQQAPVTTAKPSGSAPTTVAASGGGVAPPPAKVTTTTAAPTETTAPEAVASTTTTTIPAAAARFVGTWKNTNASTNFEPQTIIRADSTNLYVHGYGACSPSYCDWGEAPTAFADANDGTINVTLSGGGFVQRITYQSNGQLAIHTDRYSGGALQYSKDEVFAKA
ncbi:MAG TPA: hypothetical protein VHN98_07430 [Acidimicrobiales bacterium]|nr:hypothetical protein [Acidimicrobiales bacterium]